MKQPAISIIVPVYNAEKYLRRCIDSIISQSLTNFELILVDDGSSDHSPQICDEYASRDNRIKLIHKKNAGVSAARNDGLDIAQGEFITFVDSDDWVDEGYLECQYENKTFDYVIGTFINEPNGKIRKLRSKTFVGERLKDYVSISYLSNGYPWGKLFKSKIIKDNSIKFKNIKVYEDLLFCLEYARNCTSICCTANAHYHYFNPVEKSVPEKFPLTINEVDWLYKNTQKEVDLISTKFRAKPVCLLFNFYLHLNLTKFYKDGDDTILHEAFQGICPKGTKEDYYNDIFASPIRVFIDKICQIRITDYKKSIEMMKVLYSANYSSFLTSIRYNSKVQNICAYSIKNRLFSLALATIVLSKIKAKLFSK